MRGWNRLTVRTRRALLVVAVPLVVGLAFFGYWTLSPLFYDVRVSEGLGVGETASSVLLEGAFQDGDGFHKAAGTARLVATGEGLLLRFEEGFQTTNGPDLFVWLVKGEGVKDGYLDLGRLKGNIGAQNYPVPEDTDPATYTQVFIWCKAFSVLFGSAKLVKL